MPRENITVSVKRITQASNGAGGYISTENVVYSTLIARTYLKRFKKKYDRREMGSNNSTGPGDTTAVVPFFSFDPGDNGGFPTILVNDIIIHDSLRYKVFLPRYYAQKLQVDAELLY